MQDPASAPAITPSLECRMWIEERYLQLRERELGRGDNEAPASWNLFGECVGKRAFSPLGSSWMLGTLRQMGHKGTEEKERGKGSSRVTKRLGLSQETHQGHHLQSGPAEGP